MKVLIFTNLYSWGILDLKDCNPVKEQWRNLIPADEDSIVKCVLGEGGPVQLQPVEDCRIQDGIYLVNDELDEELFDCLMEQCSEEDTFILVHDSGIWTRDRMPLRLLANCRHGNHENKPCYLYQPIFIILADEAGNKMERVLDILRPSENALLQLAANVFMSGCMTPYNGDKDFLAAKDRLVTDPRFGALVYEFYENVYPNVTKAGERPQRTYRSYRGQFIPVRDALNATLWS